MAKNIDETHEWRKIEKFVEGDYICGLGKNMLITSVVVGEKIVRLSYIHNDEEKIKVDAVGADYIALKRKKL
jgi:hypothetical protein